MSQGDIRENSYAHLQVIGCPTFQRFQRFPFQFLSLGQCETLVVQPRKASHFLPATEKQFISTPINSLGWERRILKGGDTPSLPLCPRQMDRSLRAGSVEIPYWGLTETLTCCSPLSVGWAAGWEQWTQSRALTLSLGLGFEDLD